MSTYEVQIEGAVFSGREDLPRHGYDPSHLMSVASRRTPSEPIWNPTGLQSDALLAAERLAFEAVPLDGRTISAEVYRCTKDGRRVRVTSACAQLWDADKGIVLVDSRRGSRYVRVTA